MNEPSSSGAHERHAWGRRFFSQLQRTRDLFTRRWWVVVIFMVPAIGVGFLLNLLLPTQYVSVGQMIVSMTLNSQDTQETPVYSEEQQNFLGTQAALMQGDEVLSQARDGVASQYPGIVPRPVDLDVTVLPRTTIFILNAYGANPQYTKAYLEQCMTQYMNLKRQLASGVSSSTISALQLQQSGLETRIEQNGDQLNAFLATNDAALLEEATSVGYYLTALYENLANAQAQLDLLRNMTPEQYLFIQQGMGQMSPGFQPPATDPNNPTPVNSGEQSQFGMSSGFNIGMEYLYADQQAQMLTNQQIHFSQFLKAGHPQMLQIQSQLDTLNQLKDIYRNQSAEQLSAQISALKLQISNLESQTTVWGKQNLALSSKSAEYDRIKSEGDRIEELYDDLSATLATLEASTDTDPESMTIYQHASDAIPDKSLPVKRVVIAGLLGMALGFAVLMLLARVDDRISTSVELEELFDEEILGQIPREKAKAGPVPLIQVDDQRHPFVEAYRNLRSSLLYMAETGTRPRTILVTSSVPNDGKSVTAANFAIMLAMAGSRVLIIDADLRKGDLHNRFGVNAEGGLSEALSQNIDWRKAVKPTSTANLFLLPRGATTQRSSEMFIGEGMKKLLQDSAKEYDYVILDTAPVMAADDVTSLAPRIDGVIFVVRAKFTSARVARASLDMLYQRKAKILGLVFNSVHAAPGAYYYYHRYKDYYAVPQAK